MHFRKNQCVNMKIVFGVILFCVAVARSAGEPNPLENGVYDYHRRFGIPEASRIRKLESESSEAQGRIVGGSTTTIWSVPYQAGLILRVLIFTSVCGGTVISDSRILTAAHCFNDGNNIAQSVQVILGSNFLFSGGTRMDTNDVVLYPGYNPWIAANDIAVIRISGNVIFSAAIQPINLPSGSELNLNYVGTNALASGYGITRDGDSVSLTQTINSVNLQVLSNGVCANTYNIIQSHHLCTNGAARIGICGGDTGGPLVATVNSRRILIGVGSFTANSGCQAGLPSGFTRVTSFVSWIHSQ